MINWKKHGLIFDPTNRSDWMKSHCQLPLADQIDGCIYKIYFASRGGNQVSQIGSITIDINNPKQLLEISKEPILTNGDYGCFDEHGVFPSSIINIGQKKYMYYVGWVKGIEAPMFYTSIGLAISNDGGLTFQRHSNSPIVSRSQYDPCLVTSPNVIKVAGEFKMTYVSGLRWFRNDKDKLQSQYHIKLATSLDGINWTRKGEVAVDFKNLNETNIARPSVIFKDGKFHMWFSYVEKDYKYKMGYASSFDFISWNRDDKLSGIALSKNGFDNEMTCYPNVFNYNNKYFMLYNGNNYGEQGFGLAVQI
tara:strand:- start:5512 stop:6432 length:921 start_codon:yes stop_codon:yes gene_type:complete